MKNKNEEKLALEPKDGGEVSLRLQTLNLNGFKERRLTYCMLQFIEPTFGKRKFVSMATRSVPADSPKDVGRSTYNSRCPRRGDGQGRPEHLRRPGGEVEDGAKVTTRGSPSCTTACPNIKVSAISGNRKCKPKRLPRLRFRTTTESAEMADILLVCTTAVELIVTAPCATN